MTAIVTWDDTHSILTWDDTHSIFIKVSFNNYHNKENLTDFYNRSRKQKFTALHFIIITAAFPCMIHSILVHYRQSKN
jgi:hypothetical protein